MESAAQIALASEMRGGFAAGCDLRQREQESVKYAIDCIERVTKNEPQMVRKSEVKFTSPVANRNPGC